MHLSKINNKRLQWSFRCALILLLGLALALMLLPALPQKAHAITSAQKQAEADALVLQLDALQTELTNTQAKLDAAVLAESKATGRKEEAKAKEDEAARLSAELQKKMSERAVESYRRGSIGYLNILFGASNFSEFITTWDFVSRINEQDTALSQETKLAKQAAEEARLEYTEQERIATQKKDEISELEASLRQKTDEMSAELDKMNEEIAELLAQEEAAAEAARLAAAAASGGSIDPALIERIGDFVHPCPAGYISSTFGWRSFDNSYHKGLDLAAGAGTPIYAIRGGTVIISGYNGSAGYWVVIAHGGGIVSKYMHAYTQPYVSTGQTVSAGQVIAGVGNTGNSFGDHLHFQLEINGVAVDPYPFLY